MKATFFWGQGAAFVLVWLAVVVGGCKSSTKSAGDEVPVAVAVQPPTAAPAAIAPEVPPEPVAPQPSLIMSGAPTPSTPALTPAAEELVKLAQSGVSEEVMMAYVGNSNDRFNLGSDQIIYLNDLGVPQTVVKTMIQRDTILAGTAAAAMPPDAATPPPVAPEPTFSSPPPPPAYIADQQVASPPLPDYTPAYTDDNASDYSTPDPSSDYFSSSLTPYGAWVDVGGYGRCWQPTVGVVNPEWQPYCDAGRWIDTDNGWYWQSDYSWGWAAFHYGRWLRDGRWGWVWRPDSTWGPAWVSWRRSADYCGWAPLPPGVVFVPGVGFRFHNRSVGFDFDFGLGAGLYTFVRLDHFCDDTPRHHRVDRAQVAQIFHQTTVINNVTVRDDKRIINHGIDPRSVAAASHREIHEAVIHDLPANGGAATRPDRLDKAGQTLVVWRPQLPVRTAGTPSGTHNPNAVPVSFPTAPKPHPIVGSSPANTHFGDPNRTGSKQPVPVHLSPDDQSQLISKPHPTLPAMSTPSGLANRGQGNPSAQTLNPSMQPTTPPMFRIPSFAKQPQPIPANGSQDQPSAQGKPGNSSMPYRAPQAPAQPQPVPVFHRAPAYTPPAVALSQEPARPTYIVPTAPAFNNRTESAYEPQQSVAPAHVAPPSSGFSGNQQQYQPSYSPPPTAAAPPVYHHEAPAAAPAPAYHPPASESHAAPTQQPSSNSSSSQSSSSKNH